MTDTPISFELLNAYVDGELDAAEAARVARAVAEDPELAHEVAALARLRSAVAESVQPPEIEVPTKPARSLRGLALAASIALALLLAGTAWMMARDETPSGWQAQAWLAHDKWQAGTEAPAAGPGLLPAGYDQSLRDGYLPDLTASRLRLVHLAERSIAEDVPALLAGYRGTRGCRISLMIFPAQGTLTEEMLAFQQGSGEAFGWRVGALDYVILSDGMESRRFQLLAESVRKSSLRHAPFDAQTRMALRSSRDSAAPCAA